jgi:EAL domain-containing protein (putative c-di-GMP-specific phosphodiesterase class I)
MSRQNTEWVMDAAVKDQNAWAVFTTIELKTKLAELQKLVDSGMLSDRSLQHQFLEMGIIENELAEHQDA